MLPVFRLNPTVHNPVAGEPDTPSKSLSLPVTLGEGTTDQLEPSQCSTQGLATTTLCRSRVADGPHVGGRDRRHRQQHVAPRARAWRRHDRPGAAIPMLDERSRVIESVSRGDSDGPHVV